MTKNIILKYLKFKYNIYISYIRILDVHTCPQSEFGETE